VTSSKKSLDKAKSNKDKAKKMLAMAKAANVDFGTIPYNQLTPGQCGTFFNHANYKKAMDVQNKAQAAYAKAQGSHAAAQKAHDQVVAAAADAEMKCLCRAKKAHDKGWKQVKATKANAGLDWKTAHNVMCVLDGTPAKKCKVPPQPTIKAPKLSAEAAKMNGSTCKDGLCYKPNVYYQAKNGVGQTSQCGIESCGQFVGLTYSRVNTNGYKLSGTNNPKNPFSQNSKLCASKFTGSHWCTEREMKGFTKDSFELLRKDYKKFYNSNSLQNIPSACGTWQPNCGQKGCWYFNCSRDYGNKWGKKFYNCQDDTVICCKGKPASP